MAIETVNPATGELVRSFEPLSDDELNRKLQRAAEAFRDYRRTSFAQRAAIAEAVARLPRAERELRTR